METECEAYVGKPTSDESESESSCSDGEEESKISIIDVTDEIESEIKSEVSSKAADDVTADLEKLQVKDEK